MPMASDDAKAVAVASRLVREIGYEPVLVGGLAAMGKHLVRERRLPANARRSRFARSLPL